jgi:PelA/Pel-15E family pectate lyase
MRSLLLLILLLSLSLNLTSQNKPISLNNFYDGIHHWNLVHANRNYPRLDSSQIIQIADNFVNWQNKDGGWPKNIDWLGVFDIDSARMALNERNKTSTLDNRNTWPQIEYLSEVYAQTKDEKYKNAAERGIQYLISTQNISGGWRGWDVDAITFNDDIMTGVMLLFLKIKEKNPQFTWVNKSLYKKVTISLNKAINVTLRCQITVNGKRTAWCQQHDHMTFQPVKARSFELPSITAKESCEIVKFLMSIKNPSPEITEAIESAINWFKGAAIKGIRLEKIKIPQEKVINQEYPYDLVVVRDSLADPIWARFYEIDTNVPFMCTRAGNKVYKLEDVDPERRTGYEWYGYWPVQVLNFYDTWKRRNAMSTPKLLSKQE